MLRFKLSFDWCFHGTSFSIILLLIYLYYLKWFFEGSMQLDHVLFFGVIFIFILTVGVFRPFTFRLIIDMLGFRSTILILVLFVLFFLPVFLLPSFGLNILQYSILIYLLCFLLYLFAQFILMISLGITIYILRFEKRLCRINSCHLNQNIEILLPFRPLYTSLLCCSYFIYLIYIH